MTHFPTLNSPPGQTCDQKAEEIFALSFFLPLVVWSPIFRKVCEPISTPFSTPFFHNFFSVSIEAQIKSRTTVVLCDVSVIPDCRCEEVQHHDHSASSTYVKKI
jgi:hypothetical protein